LVLDPNSGDLYVGAVNRLFKFDKDLSKYDDDVVTGPRLDNPVCSYPFGNVICKDKEGIEQIVELTDNYNKILLLDLINNKVLACGSIFQGTCQNYDIELTTNVSYTNRPEYFVAANNEHSPTVAFIDNDALYVGSTYSGSGNNAEIRSDVPIISSRHFSGRDSFKYTAEDQLEGSGTFLKLGDAARETYVISYVTGFGVGGFSYFLTTQKKSISDESYISKIVQICQADETFNSYVEIPLDCKTQDLKYNLVTSAVLTKPGKDLADHLGIAVTNEILVATFVKSSTSSDQGKESAICIYSVDKIRQKFTENLQNCFNGYQTNRGEHFGASVGHAPTCTTLSVSQSFKKIQWNEKNLL
jgi:plexin A